MEKDKHSLLVIKEKLRTMVEVQNDLSVLAEFCAVMLSSKKGKEEIISELELFLNGSAGPFAEWLVTHAETEISARKAADTKEAAKVTEKSAPAAASQDAKKKSLAPTETKKSTAPAQVATKKPAAPAQVETKKPAVTAKPTNAKSVKACHNPEFEVVVTDDGDGSVVVVDDEDEIPRKRGAKGYRSPISTDSEMDATESEQHTTKRLLLRARADRPNRVRLVEKKVRLARKVDRASPLGNALLMARAVKDATGVTENIQPPRLASRLVKRTVVKRTSMERNSRKRSVRPLRKRRSQSHRSPSVESFSVRSSEPCERKHCEREAKRDTKKVTPCEKAKTLVKAKIARTEPRETKQAKCTPSAVASSNDANVIKANAFSNANTVLGDKELDRRIARLERLEKLQEQTRKNREELADMDIPIRMQPAIGRPPVRLKARTPPVTTAPVMIPKTSPSPTALRRTTPFEVVKLRVIVDKLEVNAGLVKADGDPVKTLTRGEIVEQTSHQVMDGGVQLIPIAHPSSSRYPGPIGWVTLDTTSVGGQKCLEPGPAFIKGGKHAKGKGKTHKGWKSQSYEEGKGGKAYAGWTY